MEIYEKYLNEASEWVLASLAARKRAEKVIADIAKKHLKLSLTAKGSDSDDFKDLGVLAIKDALMAAYAAGANQGN